MLYKEPFKPLVHWKQLKMHHTVIILGNVYQCHIIQNTIILNIKPTESIKIRICYTEGIERKEPRRLSKQIL